MRAYIVCINIYTKIKWRERENSFDESGKGAQVALNERDGQTRLARRHNEQNRMHDQCKILMRLSEVKVDQPQLA